MMIDVTESFRKKNLHNRQRIPLTNECVPGFGREDQVHWIVLMLSKCYELQLQL